MLRTALHRDPTLDTPLHRLVEIYRKAGHTEELLQMYRAHVAKYPQDANGYIVFVRLLRAAEHRDADRVLNEALKAHPKSAYLHYLRFESLQASRPSKALDQLVQAIKLTDRSDRKIDWIKTLLPLAVRRGKQDLAKEHARRLLEVAGATPDAQLAAAKVVQSHGFHAMALEALKQAAAAIARAADHGGY